MGHTKTSVFEQGAKGRGLVVAPKLKNLQWLVENGTLWFCSNKNRSLKKELGYIFSRRPNRREWTLE